MRRWIEVLPEAALGHLPFEIAAGRRHDAYVDRNLRAASDALELLLDEHAQKLALRVHRHVGDFVDIERAVMGFFERANFPCGLARLLDAEELDLDPVRRHGGRVDRDERTVRAA